ncbi:signal transduction histidine kinase [Candidatus Magnetoovum chiemensis]|nr:signal transduction histidine kinase [Candidatus Magnetoovum chiemensis]
MNDEELKDRIAKLEQTIRKHEDELSCLKRNVEEELSKRQLAEKELKYECQKFYDIMNSVDDGIYIVSADFIIEYINPVIEKEFGAVKGRKCYEYLHDRNEPCPWCKNDEVFAGKSVRWQWRCSKNNKTYDLFDAPIRNADGGISKFEIFHDITNLRTAQDSLKREVELQSAIAEVSEALLSADTTVKDIARIVLKQARQLTDSVHGYTSEIEKETGDEISQTMTDMMETGECNIVDDKRQIRFPKGPDGLYKALYGHALNTKKAFYTNNPKTHEAYNACAPDGHLAIERYLSVPAIVNDKLIGQIALANSSRDYTDLDLDIIKRLAGIYAIAIDRKRMEQEMERALAEKELLLIEIHHRVKNNMAVISGLLSMQRSFIESDKYIRMFKECENRIKSMALVHEKLYKWRDLGKVDFSDYVKSLSHFLCNTYEICSDKVMVKINVRSVNLGIDTALPCGLLINELMSNAFKYAFPNGNNGEISVVMQNVGSGEIELIVKDTGIGMPFDIDIHDTDSLGYQIITGIAEVQLNGKVELRRDGGTEVIVRFRELDEVKRY